MHAKFLKAAAAIIAGAAIYIAPMPVQAEDAGLNEPGGANYVEARSDAQSQASAVRSEQLTELPAQQKPMSDALPSAESQGYFFMADPVYPQDFPDGGSD